MLKVLFFLFLSYTHIYKATINIIFFRIGKTDPITYGLTLAIRYINIDINVDFWSQQLSFSFVGLMIIFSIRGLLIQLLKVSESIFGRTFIIKILPHITHD